MKSVRFLAVLSLSITFLVAACSGGGSSSPAPTTGTLSGVVTDSATSNALAGVSVIAFDASTNAPAASTVQTSATGSYSFTLKAGSYYVKLYAQSYDPVPASPLLTPVPLTVTAGAATTDNVQMTASALPNSGWITGTVTSGGTGVGGVLVAAEASGVAYTSFTDSSGNYAIYNVLAAGYNVKAYIGGYSSDAPAATVTANTGVTANPALTALAAGAGTVTTAVSMVSNTNGAAPATMVTSLVHPVTKETIPGLSASMPWASSVTYTIPGVADGVYVVRTTFANDKIVVDPDALVKFGEPTVTVLSGVQSAAVTITTTSATDLTSPTNALTSTVPVAVTGSTPTFTWATYPSVSDWVIEVVDASTGTVIWGGFTNTAGTITKNISIPAATLSAVYNSDGKATAPLVVGKTYRWRIYASQTIGNQPWKLISMSEDQMGLITIQ